MRWLRAPAKLNLTLRLVGRRADGYHELESLVAFAGLCDWLGFDPGDDLSLEVFGPRARGVGPVHENLVVRGARSLAVQIPGSRLGRFRLIKRIPAAAGLGGGSADAAAALRLLATEGGLSVDDPRVLASARATGADVLACLAPQARTMRGIGHELGPAVRLPRTFVVLVNPQVQAPTPKVFAPLSIMTLKRQQSASRRRSKLCLKDCPKSLTPRRSGCQVQVRVALPCFAISGAQLPRSGPSRRSTQNGGSRPLSFAS